MNPRIPPIAHLDRWYSSPCTPETVFAPPWNHREPDRRPCHDVGEQVAGSGPAHLQVESERFTGELCTRRLRHARYRLQSGIMALATSARRTGASRRLGNGDSSCFSTTTSRSSRTALAPATPWAIPVWRTSPPSRSFGALPGRSPTGSIYSTLRAHWELLVHPCDCRHRLLSFQHPTPSSIERLLPEMGTSRRSLSSSWTGVTDFYGYFERVFAEVGDLIDIFRIADDIGAQNNLFISPKMLDRFRRRAPRSASIWRTVTASRFSSHGWQRAPGDPRLIDWGVDVLDPVQPEIPSLMRR